MFTFYLIVAVLGGSVFVVQFVLALVGVGADDLDLVDDMPDDLPEVTDPQGSMVDHGSTWFFGVISFRSVVAAMTFFGLGGIAALQAQLPEMVSVVIALGAGLAAMYGVHFLMRSLHQLRHDGTIRVEQSLGARGTVYVPIPPHEQGSGMVQLRVHGRIAEYSAVTPVDVKLPTGTTVVVTEVISPTTLRVEPVTQPVVRTEPAEA